MCARGPVVLSQRETQPPCPARYSASTGLASPFAELSISEPAGSGQNLGVRQPPCGMRWSTFHRERQPARWQRDGRLWVTISCVGVFPCVCCRCRPRNLPLGTKISEDHCGTANHSRSGYPYCLPDRCRVLGNALAHPGTPPAQQQSLPRLRTLPWKWTLASSQPAQLRLRLEMVWKAAGRAWPNYFSIILS